MNKKEKESKDNKKNKKKQGMKKVTPDFIAGVVIKSYEK